MRKMLILLMGILGIQLAVAQTVIPRQEIPYNVNYHWGIIDVTIATGTVTIQSDGTNFYGTLDGTSIPWEGRVICVSDTLSATMGQNGPLSESVNFQTGWYRRPPAEYFRSAGYNSSNPAYYKNIQGEGQYDASHDSMEAITVTSDMIGMYYFSHVIDFSRMHPGQTISIPISGGYAHTVEVTYQGPGTYSAAGRDFLTYDCTFEYSYGGGMSGYPVECKIGTDIKVPLYLSASLPAGRVEMLYNP